MKNKILKTLILTSVLFITSSCSFILDFNSSNSNNSSTSSEVNDNINSQGNYYDFTTSEKEALTNKFGFSIPFITCKTYSFEYDQNDDAYYYVAKLSSVSSSLFRNYYNKFKANYTYVQSFYSNGVEWYEFTNNGVVLLLTNYISNGYQFVQVSMYVQGNEDKSGLITNHSKGLPNGTNGVYNVDFTKGLVKNVHEQYQYENGCPTITENNKTLNVLVIPVEFSDITASSKGYTIESINTALNGDSSTLDYYSLKDFYYTSSYGQLNINFDIMDSWFKPSQNSSYYKNLKFNYGSSTLQDGEQVILDEFLKAYDSKIDFSKYDSDNNGTIDAVVMINTLTIDSKSNFNWAFRYWNYYLNGNNEFYTYDNVRANDYLWASYQFLYEKGSTGLYTNKTPTNTYTFLHEFGHVLGLDDYYDTTGKTNGPLDSLDMMDSTVGDHNPYSKFNLGWITTSRLVTDEVTLDLTSYVETGETIIIANDFDEELGAYQEYYVLMYYKNDKLNTKGGYFDKEGIVMYHVNSSLVKEEYYDTTYYDVYNNNSSYNNSSGYGTQNNLVEYVYTSSNGYVHTLGTTSSSNVTNSYGEKIPFTFHVDNLTSEKATLTFTKNN